MCASALPDVITFILVGFLLIGLYLAGCTVVVEFLDWLDRRDLATYDEAVLRASTPSAFQVETPSDQSITETDQETAS